MSVSGGMWASISDSLVAAVGTEAAPATEPVAAVRVQTARHSGRLRLPFPLRLCQTRRAGGLGLCLLAAPAG